MQCASQLVALLTFPTGSVVRLHMPAGTGER